ncbi:MAG TPA: diaminopimelate decarboxylase [Planctomycetes bacterium]|nr:diaminopimelate decarboxylase [Planctomycetota bacterium]
MHHFHYREGELCAEEVPLRDLAERYGTPLYVYSHATLTRHIRRFQRAFGDDVLVAYSVKANPNLAVIAALAAEGAGADVVSRGELQRALAAGVPPERIVFAGVGKRRDELELALARGILQLNVEVEGELELLDELGRARGAPAPVALRVNPDVPADTHRYIQTGNKADKFGIPLEEAPAMFRRAAALPGVEPVGVACHIGSQILRLEPFAEALARVRQLVLDLRAEGIDLRRIDIGGGLGVRYRDETPPTLEDYAGIVRKAVGDLGCELAAEPGRVILANAGVLLTRVLYRKEVGEKRFVIVDQAMNDLQRPALYDAFHDVWPVKEATQRIPADVVGPICETSDFLSRDGDVPDAQPGDLLCAMSAGAYGRSMSSNYNSRARAAEVLVRGDEAFLIQERETLESLWAGERIPGFLGG